MDSSTDTLVLTFLQSRDLAEITAKQYKHVIKLYSNFINLSPSDFISEAEDEEEDRIRMRKRKINKYLFEFNEHLKSLDYLCVSTINEYNTKIRSFYGYYDIELPKMRPRNKKQKIESISDIPKKEDITYTLQFTNPKYKAIILLMASSGMGRSEILSLKINDFLKSIAAGYKLINIKQFDIDELINLKEKITKNNELIIPTWNITRKKTNTPYTTFSSPESVAAIIEYLRLSPPKNIEDSLFRSTRNPDKPITENGFSTYFYRLNERAGFGKPNHQNFFRSHNLRKFFTTVLYHNDLNQLSIDWLLAHKINRTTEAYFKSDTNKLKEQYTTCIKDLSIEDVEVHTLKSPEFKKLEDELNTNKIEMKIMKEAIEMLKTQNEARKS